MAHAAEMKNRWFGWVNWTVAPSSATKTACQKLVRCIVPLCGVEPGNPVIHDRGTGPPIHKTPNALTPPALPHEWLSTTICVDAS